MNRDLQPVDAILMAGGRIEGEFARAAGTPIKALVRLQGRPLFLRALAALRATTGVRRVCLVGPESVRDAQEEPGLWQMETASALGNLQAGIDRLDAWKASHVLVCGTDVPALGAADLEDFLLRAPRKADFCMPIVQAEAYEAAFPGSPGVYVPLVEGRFTGGSQYLIRPAALQANLPLLEQMFNRRKSQLAMGRMLGLRFVLKWLSRRLTIGDVEARASELTGCICRAVRDCRPELACDIDQLEELTYMESWCEGTDAPGDRRT